MILVYRQKEGRKGFDDEEMTKEEGQLFCYRNLSRSTGQLDALVAC